jgi:hypothetical protein
MTERRPSLSRGHHGSPIVTQGRAVFRHELTVGRMAS